MAGRGLILALAQIVFVLGVLSLSQAGPINSSPVHQHPKAEAPENAEDTSDVVITRSFLDLAKIHHPTAEAPENAEDTPHVLAKRSLLNDIFGKVVHKVSKEIKEKLPGIADQVVHAVSKEIREKLPGIAEQVVHTVTKNADKVANEIANAADNAESSAESKISRRKRSILNDVLGKVRKLAKKVDGKLRGILSQHGGESASHFKGILNDVAGQLVHTVANEFKTKGEGLLTGSHQTDDLEPASEGQGKSASPIRKILDNTLIKQFARRIMGKLASKINEKVPGLLPRSLLTQGEQPVSSDQGNSAVPVDAQVVKGAVAHIIGEVESKLIKKLSGLFSRSQQARDQQSASEGQGNATLPVKSTLNKAADQVIHELANKINHVAGKVVDSLKNKLAKQLSHFWPFRRRRSAAGAKYAGLTAHVLAEETAREVAEEAANELAETTACISWETCA